MDTMDPVSLATAILTFSGVVSDLATIQQKFSDAPKILADIEQDCRIILLTVLHTAELKRRYRSSEKPKPTFREPSVKIVMELSRSINTIREAVLRLLKQVNEANAPSDSALFKTWKKRIYGFYSLPGIQRAHEEIRRNMDAFERLRKSSDSEILIKTFSAVKSRNSTSSSSDTCSFEQLSIIDIDIDIDIDTPWQLPPKAIQEGRRTLLKLIHDRRPGNHMNPDSRYNLDLISMILSDCNIDPNFGTSDRGMYPLHLAAKYKDAKLAKLLIQHGAKVSIHDNQGRTPLHVAAELSVNDSISLAVVKAILSTTDMGNCVERFLDRANAVDSAGHTILWKASASISSPRKQPTAAATATATAMFQYLLTLPAEVINFRSPSDKEYPTALWAAFSPRGCVETARALLFQANADPLVRAERDNNCTLLHKVEWPTVGILYDELISKCAVWAKLKPVTEYSPDPDKHSPDLVPDSESKTTCREVNYCTTPNNLGFQPIHLAASSGLLPLCHSLLSRGIDINTPDAQGATPLSLASEAGHFSLVYDFVVNRGADVTVRDEFGHDAFVAACSGGHVPVACFLLGRQFRVPPHHQLHDSHDADSHHLHDNDTDSQDSECEGKGNGNGTTKRKGKWASRDINEVDATGLSPVYIAAIMGHVDVVKFLVDLGANTDGIEDDKIASIMEGTCEKKKGERQLRVDAIRKLLGLSPLKVGVDVGNQKELVPPRGSLRLRRNKTR